MVRRIHTIMKRAIPDALPAPRIGLYLNEIQLRARSLLVKGQACAVGVTGVKRGGPRGACAGQRAVGPVPGGPLARRLFLGRIIYTPWPVFVSALGKVTALRRRRGTGSGDLLRRTGRTRKPGRLNQRHWVLYLPAVPRMSRDNEDCCASAAGPLAEAR